MSTVWSGLAMFCLGGFEPLYILYCTARGQLVWDGPQSPRNRLSYARTFFHGLSYREGMPEQLREWPYETYGHYYSRMKTR